VKFADWVPIIVAAASLAGVLILPLLSGNRPRQQLDALKTVREVLGSTNDDDVKAALRAAERHLAARIELRYRPLSKKWNRTYTTVASVVIASLLAVALGTFLVVTGIAQATGLNIVAASVGAGTAIIGLLISAFRRRQDLSDYEVVSTEKDMEAEARTTMRFRDSRPKS
jgi:hypothetical protein